MVAFSLLAGNSRFLNTVLAAAIVVATSATASAKTISGKGTIQISDVGRCSSGADTCYSVSGDFPPGGKQDLSFTFAGQGMTDPSTCKTKKDTMCCQSTINLPVTVDKSGTEVGTFDCAFAGSECEKPAASPTSETLKGKLVCSDGTGYFEGKTGSGKLSAEIDPATGDGTVSASISGN